MGLDLEQTTEGAQQVAPPPPEVPPTAQSEAGAPPRPEEPPRAAAPVPLEAPSQHLSAVPDNGTAQEDKATAAREPRRASPKPDGKGAAGAVAREERAGAAQHQATVDGGATKDQVRRYRERWNRAKTAAEKAEAIQYGAERGVPEAVELARLLRSEPSSQQPEAANAAQPSATPGAAAPNAAQPQSPPQPPAPRIMGQPREAVAAVGEQAKWLADLFVGLGKMAGWEAQPSEPLKLFEGMPGVEPIEVKGDPRKRIAELAAVELAAMVSKHGGQEESSTRRRVELGVLMLGTAGPGLLPLASKLVGVGVEKLTQVSGVLAGLVRRWRR